MHRAQMSDGSAGVWMYISMYIYIYIFVCIYIYMYICVYSYVHICKYIRDIQRVSSRHASCASVGWVCWCVDVYVYIHIYIRMYIFV